MSSHLGGGGLPRVDEMNLCKEIISVPPQPVIAIPIFKNGREPRRAKPECSEDGEMEFHVDTKNLTKGTRKWNQK